MAARVDFEKYPNGCETAENLIAIPQGGFMRRTGTRFVKEVKTSANATRLLPFEFSTAQSYMIEAGSAYFRFYRDQASITVPNTVAAITNGTFDSNITGWTNSSSGAASIAWQELNQPVEGTFHLATAADDNWGDGVAGRKHIGLKFTNTTAGTVTKVRIDISAIGTGFNATASIYSNNAGSPGTIVGIASDVTALTSAGIKSFTWTAAGPSLSAATAYWVVLSDTGTTGNVNIRLCTDQGTTHGSGEEDTITAITDERASFDYRVEITVDDGVAGNGALALIGATGETAIATQSVTTTASIEHVLSYRIIGDTGDRVLVRIGTASGASDIINDFIALPGYHTTAFTTTATTVYIQFRNARAKTTYVDDVEFLDNEPMELVTPYTTAELTAIHHAQSADILYLCHEDHPVMKLERRGHTTWSLVNVELGDGPWQDENTTTTYTLQASATTGFGITITAAGGHTPFATTDVGRLVRIRNAAGEPGYAVITAVNSTIAVTADVLRAFPDAAANATWRLGAFSETTGHPSSITFYEQRLVLASTEDQPQTFWMSQSADIENFRPDSFVSSAVTVQDDDATDFSIASTKVNKIAWMRSSSTGMVIGTYGGEWLASSSSDSATITPTDITVKQQSNNGGLAAMPVRVNDVILFIQRAGRKILDFSYTLERDGFQGRDITILSDHINRGGFSHLEYQKSPDSTVYAIRDDGILCAVTYYPEHQVVGWTRFVMGGAFSSGDAVVESVAVIPGADGGGRTLDSGDRDEVWIIVKRTVNGATVRHIEFFEKAFEGVLRQDYASDSAWKTALLSQQADAFYVDSGLTYDSTPTTTITGLTHLEGQTVKVLGDGVEQADKTVSSGQITITSASTVQVGLGYTHKYKSLKLPYGNPAGTSLGQTKRIHGITFILLDTAPFEFARNADTLETIVYKYWSSNAVFSGEQYEHFDGGNKTDPRIVIESDAPLPFTLLGMVPEINTNQRF